MYLVVEEDPQAVDHQEAHQAGVHQVVVEEARQEAEESSHYPDPVLQQAEEEANLGATPQEYSMGPAAKQMPL